MKFGCKVFSVETNCSELPSWEPKQMLTCPLGWRTTFICLFGSQNTLNPPPPRTSLELSYVILRAMMPNTIAKTSILDRKCLWSCREIVMTLKCGHSQDKLWNP